MVLAWVLVKSVGLSVVEIIRAVLRRHRRRAGGPRGHGWWWLALRLSCSVWLRQLYTLVVASDLYAGVPAIYVNYIDYDVFAHAFGPHHRHALRAPCAVSTPRSSSSARSCAAFPSTATTSTFFRIMA